VGLRICEALIVGLGQGWGEQIDAALVGRLRSVIGGETATEAELRKLWEQADAWARTLDARIQGSERRLDELTSEAAPELAEVTAELRRIESLRPQLREVRKLHRQLEQRAHELRASWARSRLR
jgi:hypothetical protein